MNGSTKELHRRGWTSKYLFCHGWRHSNNKI